MRSTPTTLLSAIPFVALLICLLPLPLRGQGPRLTPPLTSYQQGESPVRARAWADSTARTRTYWVEGGIIGAVGGLVIAQVLNELSCGDSANCGGDRGLFLGLIAGFVVGSLIGGG